MSGRSAAGVFTRGVLSQCLDWNALAADRDDVLAVLEALELPMPSDQLLAREPARAAKQIMTTLLDHFTDVQHMPAVRTPELCSLLSAELDGYVPSSDHLALQQVGT